MGDPTPFFAHVVGITHLRRVIVQHSIEFSRKLCKEISYSALIRINQSEVIVCTGKCHFYHLKYKWIIRLSLVPEYVKNILYL